MLDGFWQICGIINIEISGLDASEVPVRQIPGWQIHAKGVPVEKALKTSAEGRRCNYPDCHRLLSIYNHQTYCRVHQEQAASKEKNKPYRHAGK